MSKIIMRIETARYFLFIFGIFMLYILPWIGLICLFFFVLSFVIYKRNENMTKEIAIKIINKKFGLELTDKNTHLALKNGDTWKLEMYVNSKNITSFIILNNNKTNKIHLFELKPNDDIYKKLFGVNYYILAFLIDDSTFVENFTLTNFNKFHICTIKY